jgi:hypothetical protein
VIDWRPAGRSSNSAADRKDQRVPVVMRILGTAIAQLADSTRLYLRDYDPHTARDSSDVVLTPDIEHAKRFADAGAALTCWNTLSEIVPLRYDRRPNKPLTAYTITMESVEGD